MPPRKKAPRRKDPIAVALAKRRWKGTTVAERRAAAQKAVRARWDRVRAAAPPPER